MTNCIFICIFNNEHYIKMFYMLLESLYIYGNMDDNIEILLYTSTSFMEIIKTHYLYNENIKFEINDTYDSVDKACKARLDLFNLKSIDNYSKVLYLDTDILIKNDIQKIFDVVKEDILYVLEEGRIDISNPYKTEDDFLSHDNWGCLLFQLNNELNNYDDKSAFTSGILLFNNCEKIKMLFDKTSEHILNSPYKFGNHDQPYIIYNAFKYNLYNNKILSETCINNNLDVTNDKSIHHFPGGPGVYENKLYNMGVFMYNLKLHTLYHKLYHISNDNNIKNNINIINKSYSWDDTSITFLENNKMNALGDGQYVEVNKILGFHFVIADFGSRKYTIIFNDDYTEFTSIANHNGEIKKSVQLLN